MHALWTSEGRISWPPNFFLKNEKIHKRWLCFISQKQKNFHNIEKQNGKRINRVKAELKKCTISKVTTATSFCYSGHGQWYLAWNIFWHLKVAMWSMTYLLATAGQQNIYVKIILIWVYRNGALEMEQKNWWTKQKKQFRVKKYAPLQWLYYIELWKPILQFEVEIWEEDICHLQSP